MDRFSFARASTSDGTVRRGDEQREHSIFLIDSSARIFSRGAKKRLHVALGPLGCGGLSAEREVNGMLQELVMADWQAAETSQTWPSTRNHPT
jgi:hypothetical protein